MLGAIIGDIVGSRFEFNNNRSKDFTLLTPACFPTDDSIMTMAVAKALMETEKNSPDASDGQCVNQALLSEMTQKYMREIGQKYPNCGYGGRFARWMFSADPKPYHSFGNGAAMRVSPAGYAARSIDEAKTLSYAVTSVTHNHPEGLKGAEATAVAITMARLGCLKSEIRDTISREYYPLDFTIDQIRPAYQFNETCQWTVPQAIECFLESESFEDAIRIAISLGGDSDTLAAIAGSIAGACYPIPIKLRSQVLSYLDASLRAIFNEWEAFMSQAGKFLPPAPRV